MSPLLMAETITLRTMFQILKKSTMKRVRRMVARTMMMVMTIAMMTATQTLHSTLVVQMMESMSWICCRVMRGRISSSRRPMFVTQSPRYVLSFI